MYTDKIRPEQRRAYHKTRIHLPEPKEYRRNGKCAVVEVTPELEAMYLSRAAEKHKFNMKERNYRRSIMVTPKTVCPTLA